MFGIHRRIFNALPAAVTSLTITLLTSGLLAVGLLPGASDARRQEELLWKMLSCYHPDIAIVY